MTLSDNLTYIFRLKKVLTGKDFYLHKDIRCTTMQKGNEGAAWTFDPTTINTQSIVYSFGVGLDISFDLSLIDTFGLKLHTFDPTPKSIDWIKSLELPQNLIFHPIGIANYDGQTQFFSPVNKTHISHTSVEGLYKTEPIQVPVKRLSTIMTELGHRHIDILKIDIEGSEYDVLEDLIENKIPVQQLLVEFHHRFSNIGVNRSLDIIKKLRTYGYKVFSVSPNGEEVSFIRS